MIISAFGSSDCETRVDICVFDFFRCLFFRLYVLQVCLIRSLSVIIPLVIFHSHRFSLLRPVVRTDSQEFVSVNCD